MQQEVIVPRLALMSSDEKTGLIARCSRLTKRELQVAALMADGLCNKVIAVRMGLSYFTTCDHIASIFRKLKVRDRTLAVVMLMRGDVLV